jgi:hypothetical protein
MRLRPGSALALALLLGSLFGPCGSSIATAGPRLNAVTIGFGAGSVAGGGDRATASPVFTIGFARTVTEQVAIEGALSDVTLGDHLGFGELQVGVLVFAQPMRRVEAILPFVRVGVGVTSGDFLDFPTHPLARLGGGAEYTFKPLPISIPMVARSGSTFGLRLDANVDFVRTGAPGVGASQYVVVAANARMLSAAITLVHRF